MILKNQTDQIDVYLTDASNYKKGRAELVVIPQNESDLISFLKENSGNISIAGAGTGVNAGRIPLSGTVISMESFNSIEMVSEDSIRVEAGVRLIDLNKFLNNTSMFYPPNPTEMLAFLGGTVATNASGSRSYKYGSTREYVLEMKVILSDGRKIHIKRGHTISSPIICNDGSKLFFPEIKYASPRCKNTAGYFMRPNMDWIDLFIGSDGTLGIVINVLLKVLYKPGMFLSGVVFFEKEEDSWDLVESIRNISNPNISPCSLEYFDKYTLKRLQNDYPNIPVNAQAGIFFEQDLESEDLFDFIFGCWYEFFDNQKLFLKDSWFAESIRDLEGFHEFRKAIPLTLNEENSKKGRLKIGTDMAVENKYFIEMMNFYRDVLDSSGIDYVIFGHIGDNHLHINLLPERSKIIIAEKTYQILVDQILLWDGTIAAEHGIGKLKKPYFHQMVGEEALEDMKTVKRLFDRNWILGEGNLF